MLGKMLHELLLYLPGGVYLAMCSHCRMHALSCELCELDKAPAPCSVLF